MEQGGVGGALDEIRLVICCNECDDFNNKSICTNVHTHTHSRGGGYAEGRTSLKSRVRRS